MPYPETCQCGAPAITVLDGDPLCQEHANEWVRGEGEAARDLEAQADAEAMERGGLGFDEDHSCRNRSWGHGVERGGSIPKTDGVEGRNFVD